MAIPEDVRDRLKVLPETLTNAFGEIYNRIHMQCRHASQLAVNAFRCVQCSYELLEKLLGAGCMGAARVERVVLPWG